MEQLQVLNSAGHVLCCIDWRWACWVSHVHAPRSSRVSHVQGPGSRVSYVQGPGSRVQGPGQVSSNATKLAIVGHCGPQWATVGHCGPLRAVSISKSVTWIKSQIMQPLQQKYMGYGRCAATIPVLIITT